MADHPEVIGSGPKSQCAQAIEAVRPFVGPRPPCRQVESTSSGPAGVAPGNGEELPPDGLGHNGPGAFFEVSDGQLDHGMATMFFVQGDGGALPVGDERVVTPRREQLGLLADQAGAARDRAIVVAMGDFGYFCSAAERVGDWYPGRLVNALDGP